MAVVASQQTLLELDELDGDWEKWITQNVIGKKDFPATVQCFEELLSLLSEDCNIWREYLNYLKNFQKIEILAVYSRCCHMFMEETYFWQDYLFQLERFGQEWQKLYEVFEEALGYVEDPLAASSLYRTVIYAKLRYVKLDSIGKDTVDYASVGELYQNGYDYMIKEFGQHWDDTHNFTKNFAYFAFYRLKDVELGRKLWKEILGSGLAKKSFTWIEAANVERRFGTVEAARSLLYRGINSVFVNYDSLFDYFIQFERDEGNFDQVQRALKKVNDQMARILESEQHKEKIAPKSNKRNADQEVKKTFQKPDTPRQQGKKRPAMSEPEVKHIIKKESEPLVVKDKDGFVIPQIPIRLSPRSGGSSPINSDLSKVTIANNSDGSEKPTSTPMEVDVDPTKTVFVSNLDYGVTEADICNFFPGNTGVRLILRPGTNVSKGYGYVDFATSDDAEAALKLDRAPYKGRPVFVSAYNPHEKGEHAEFKYSTAIERNKLFVKNLPFKCNNDQLKEAFSVYGKVKDARIVTKKNGISKCCGYVDYETEADTTKALTAQIEIGGRPIQCFISNPPSKEDDKPFNRQQPPPRNNPKPPTSALGSRSKPMATPSAAGRKMRIESFVPRSVAVSSTKSKSVK